MSAEQQNPEVTTMRKFVTSYGKPSDRKALTALGVSFLLEAVAILLIHWGMGVMGWTLHMLTNLRFFMQMHDMAHFSFFSSMRANMWIGKLIGIHTHFPFNAWRDGHNHHHKHFGNLDRLDLSQTILFTKQQYDQMKGAKKVMVRIFREPVVYFAFSVPFAWFIAVFYSVVKRYGILSLTFLEKTLSVVCYTFLLPLMGIPAWKMWLTIYCSSILGNILFHLQHSVNLPYRQRKGKWDSIKAAVEGSTLLEVPYLLRPFTNGIEYHHVHHLNTNVPSYNIQQCHEKFDRIDQKGGRKWDEFKINRVELDLAFSSLFNVMLDEEKGLLVPFDYSFFG